MWFGRPPQSGQDVLRQDEGRQDRHGRVLSPPEKEADARVDEPPAAPAAITHGWPSSGNL